MRKIETYIDLIKIAEDIVDIIQLETASMSIDIILNEKEYNQYINNEKNYLKEYISATGLPILIPANKDIDDNKPVLFFIYRNGLKVNLKQR